MFDNADLLKAGAAGIVKDAGMGNATMSLMTDGSGIFAKSFSCTIPQ